MRSRVREAVRMTLVAGGLLVAACGIKSSPHPPNRNPDDVPASRAAERNGDHTTQRGPFRSAPPPDAGT